MPSSGIRVLRKHRVDCSRCAPQAEAVNGGAQVQAGSALRSEQWAPPAASCTLKLYRWISLQPTPWPPAGKHKAQHRHVHPLAQADKVSKERGREAELSDQTAATRSLLAARHAKPTAHRSCPPAVCRSASIWHSSSRGGWVATEASGKGGLAHAQRIWIDSITGTCPVQDS